MYRRYLSILVVLIWLLPQGVAEGVDYTRWYPYSEASRLAEQGRRTLMVYFWRDGCAYCEQMNTFVLSEPAVSRLLEHCFVVASVDSQSSTFVFLAYGQGGWKETGRLFGSRPRAQFLQELKQVSTGTGGGSCE